jgi:hypothetical protein
MFLSPREPTPCSLALLYAMYNSEYGSSCLDGLLPGWLGKRRPWEYTFVMLGQWCC